MSKQTSGPSPLMAKLGDKLRIAAEVHRADPVEYSQFGELPAGIEGGIARLIDCKFAQIKPGKTNEGEYVFYAAGVVVDPKTHAGITVEGLRTQISEPVYDTPGRSREFLADHIGWIQNQLKMLGAHAESVGGDDLESTASVLKEAQPYFRFRTWKGDKQEVEQRKGVGGKENWYVVQGGKVLKGPYASEAALKAANPYAGQEPRVNHTWNGLCPYNGEAEAGAGMVDNTATAIAYESTTMSKLTAPANRIQAPATAHTHTTDRSDSNADGAEDDNLLSPEELYAMADFADAGNQESWSQLTDIAVAAGVPGEVVENAVKWREVVDMIILKRSPESATSEEEDIGEPVPLDPWRPKVGAVYHYRPIDPKTKRPVKKPIEVKVVEVHAKEEAVDLQNVANGKIVYNLVKWEALEGK